MSGPTLLKSLVNDELWNLAKMDEVAAYLAGNSTVAMPPDYLHSLL